MEFSEKSLQSLKWGFTSKISFNACNIQNCLIPKKSEFMQEYGEPMACSELLHVQWNMPQDSDVTRLFNVILHSLFHSQNLPLIYINLRSYVKMLPFLDIVAVKNPETEWGQWHDQQTWHNK